MTDILHVISAVCEILGSFLFLLIAATMHVLRPDVDWKSQGLSYYAVGPRGRWMAAGFLGLSAGFAGASLRQQGVAAVLMAAAAALLLVVAALPSNASDTRAVTDRLHRIAAFLFFICGIASVSVASRNIPQVGSAICAGVFFPLFMLRSMPWRGVFQRICFLSLAAWITLDV